MRMGPGWRNCKTCREYCAQKDPTKLIRPAMIYDSPDIYWAETLATTKRLEDVIKVNEGRMLRCV